MNNIKRISMSEKSLIVDFLNENWGSKHPLVNNDTLFNYYYADGDMTNFYAWIENDEVLAVCGYIKCSREKNSDIWISIWCAKKGKNGVGLQLMGAMKDLTGANVISCNNIRKNTMPFYTFLGYHPDKLSHYYRLAKRDIYKIAVTNGADIPESKKNENTALKQHFDIESIKKCFVIPTNLKPKKDFWYIEKRYFNYPHYKYKVFTVEKDCKAALLVIFRVNDSVEGHVLRLVDYIGEKDNFKLLSGYLDELMSEYDCEYCDMYCSGVNGEDAGFTERIGDEVIIPNYLNPLLQKNIDYYFFTSNTENFTMFRADGDQDRKNLG